MAPGSPEIGDPALPGWRPIRGLRLPAVLLSPDERVLVRIFLRRYATWCARSGHYDRIESVGLLYCQLGARPAR